MIGLPLFDYQSKAAQEIANSILSGEGLEYLLIFPRQSGKNEAVAQLLVYLLNLLQRQGGNIVYGATGDGLGRGIQRLERRLDNPWNRGQWRKAARPARRTLGQAAVVFLSTHPAAAARGETADWLLVIDEMQDQHASHLEAVFEPMRAANNATALYIGTVRTTTDALWQKKNELELLADQDGRQRVYMVSPQEVVSQNPAYGHFLDNKVSRLGRHHPIVASEYFNEPLEGLGGLFDARRLALMRGEHIRRSLTGGDNYRLATLDVAGIDEAATDPLAQLENPGRDYTVAHIFEAEPGRDDDPGPLYRAIDVFVDQGGRHFQSQNGRPNLAERLLAWLRHWEAVHLVADASGVGAGLVDWLSAKMGLDRVTGFTFTASSKAALGASFLSLVETGRFLYWAGEEDGAGPSPPLSDGWWFFTQAESCTYSLASGGRFERDLRWGVPAGKKIDTPCR